VLGSGVVPVASVPIRLPWITTPSVEANGGPRTRMPAGAPRVWLIAAMTLPAPGSVPLMVDNPCAEKGHWS
jgi:hypothetical protein